MTFTKTYAVVDPDETPEEREARLERVRRLAERDPFTQRRKVGTAPCYVCKSDADLWACDPRTRGWLRVECPACGAWGDVDPEEHEARKGPNH